MAKKIGLVGVFIGTIASGLTLWCYSYPKYVYKNLFDKKYKNYIIETLGYMLFFLVTLLIIIIITDKMVFANLLAELVVKLVVCLIILNICIVFCFSGTDNFKYYINVIFKIFNKNKKYTKDKVSNLNNIFNGNMNEENISFRHSIELDYDYNKK